MRDPIEAQARSKGAQQAKILCAPLGGRETWEEVTGDIKILYIVFYQIKLDISDGFAVNLLSMT